MTRVFAVIDKHEMATTSTTYDYLSDDNSMITLCQPDCLLLKLAGKDPQQLTIV